MERVLEGWVLIRDEVRLEPDFVEGFGGYAAG